MRLNLNPRKCVCDASNRFLSQERYASFDCEGFNAGSVCWIRTLHGISLFVQWSIWKCQLTPERPFKDTSGPKWDKHRKKKWSKNANLGSEKKSLRGSTDAIVLLDFQTPISWLRNEFVRIFLSDVKLNRHSDTWLYSCKKSKFCTNFLSNVFSVHFPN